MNSPSMQKYFERNINYCINPPLAFQFFNSVSKNVSLHKNSQSNRYKRTRLLCCSLYLRLYCIAIIINRKYTYSYTGTERIKTNIFSYLYRQTERIIIIFRYNITVRI